MDSVSKSLSHHEELTPRQIAVAAEYLLNEKGDPEKKKSVLRGLAEKGETALELAEFVTCFLDHAVDPEINPDALEGPTIDVCGTGGDQLNLFNISTTCMFIVAAAGGIVVKHGNRGITSKCGGADVLEALGIRIDLPPEKTRACLEGCGLGFFYAPQYHPAFKAVAGIRKELAAEGTRTLFNLIGPLMNPARPECQLVGVSDHRLTPVFAEILQRLGRDSAWVVHGTTAGEEGVDEVSLMGPTLVCKSGSYQEASDEEIRPEDFGLTRASVEELRGGDAKENAAILEAILSGSEKGPKRDIVVLNAATALACAGLSDHISDGIDIANGLIDNGGALRRLRKMQKLSK